MKTKRQKPITIKVTEEMLEVIEAMRYMSQSKDRPNATRTDVIIDSLRDRAKRLKIKCDDV